MLTMGASVECGNRSDAGIVSSTLCDDKDLLCATAKDSTKRSFNTYLQH
jgi:hypothetical protein